MHKLRLWEKNFGGSDGEYGKSVLEAVDGGLVVAGYTNSFGNGYELYLLKTDSSGDLLWEKSFGKSSDVYRFSVVETSDGGLVVASTLSSHGQVYLLKTDSSGNLLWEKNFGGSSSDSGYSIVETADGGLVVTGDTSSFGNNRQVYLLKTDSNGNLLWEKNFGGSDNDQGLSVIETSDGGLIVTGLTNSFGDISQVYLLKTDSNGDVLWEKNFGDFTTGCGLDVVEITGGALVLTGHTSGIPLVYMIWTDSEGNGISEPGW